MLPRLANAEIVPQQWGRANAESGSAGISSTAEQLMCDRNQAERPHQGRVVDIVVCSAVPGKKGEFWVETQCVLEEGGISGAWNSVQQWSEFAQVPVHSLLLCSGPFEGEPAFSVLSATAGRALQTRYSELIAFLESGCNQLGRPLAKPVTEAHSEYDSECDSEYDSEESSDHYSRVAKVLNKYTQTLCATQSTVAPSPQHNTAQESVTQGQADAVPDAAPPASTAPVLMTCLTSSTITSISKSTPRSARSSICISTVSVFVQGSGQNRAGIGSSASLYTTLISQSV